MANYYGLDGRRFKLQWEREIFSSPYLSRWALRPTQPPLHRITELIAWCWKPTRLRMSRNVDCVLNVMEHVQKPVFVFRRNGRVNLNKRGRQFSRLLAAEVCASAVVMLDTPCSEVAWRVLATHSMRQFPLHFPSRASPCAIQFQLESTSIPPLCQSWHVMGDLYLYEDFIWPLQDALMLPIRTEDPSDHFKICSALTVTGCIQEGVNPSLRCEGTAALKLCGLLDIKRVHTRHWHATSKLCTLPAAVK